MPRWSTNEINVLKKYYGKIQMVELRKLLPLRKPECIWVKARKLGLKSNPSLAHRKYFFNEDFFQSPNPINSYWAGLIAADGCVYPPRYVVNLSQSDIKVIRLFIQTIGYSGKITGRKTPISQKINYSISINCVKFMKDLCDNFNIIANKSLLLEPPNLSRKNSLSYIVGYIDGDGCIRIDKYGRLNVKFTGTRRMMEWINDFFNLSLTVGCRHPKKRPSDKKITSRHCLYYLDVTGKKAYQILKEMSSVHELNKIKFRRKWNKICKWEKNNLIAA